MKKEQTAEHVEEPTAVYGFGRRTKAKQKMGAGETVERIRAGLPIVEFEALQALLGLGAEELAHHLAIQTIQIFHGSKSAWRHPSPSPPRYSIFNFRLLAPFYDLARIYRTGRQ
jgi:hypothetical protein